MSIKFIEVSVFNQYIENHGEGIEIPEGRFYTTNTNTNTIIGMDNTTNDCWVEAFNNQADCFAWLNGEDEE